MKSLFSQIRTARDILANRLPAALAMLKARDVSVAIRHIGQKDHRVEVTFWFDEDGASASAAYRRCEYLYELERKQ